MKYDKTIKILQVSILITLVISLLVAFLGVGFWFKKNIHTPAVASMRSGCHFPESKTDNYISIGTTKTRYDPDIQQNVITVEVQDEIFVNGPMLLIVVRHELCHVNQFDRKYLYPRACNATEGKFLRYIQEVECYIRQNIPRKSLNESAILKGDITSVEEYLKGVELPISQ